MYYFERHQLIETNDGLIVRLFLDRNLTEFASEFDRDKRDVKASLETAAADYIQKKLPGKKIKSVVVMLGALMIAAIPFAYAVASNPPDKQSPPDPPVISAGVDTPEKPGPASGSGEVREDSLLLVNKQSPLPADYVPSHLVTPDVRFAGGAGEVRQMREDAAASLEEMFDSAQKDGVRFYAVSGYRSYERQVAVFAASAERHGGEEEANQFSARAGHSEHQTGLAMDVTSASIGYALSEKFGETKEGRWLKDNAYKFGFIIRYGEGKEAVTGYQYEPWHIRYVGGEAAEIIRNKNITLEEYLNLNGVS